MAPPQAVPICFPPPSDSPTAHILLELPPELLKLLEGSDDRPSFVPPPALLFARRLPI